MYLDKYIGIYSSTFSKTNYIYKKVTKLNDMCAKNTRTKYKFNKSKDKWHEYWNCFLLFNMMDIANISRSTFLIYIIKSYVLHTNIKCISIVCMYLYGIFVLYVCNTFFVIISWKWHIIFIISCDPNTINVLYTKTKICLI